MVAIFSVNKIKSLYFNNKDKGLNGILGLAFG